MTWEFAPAFDAAHRAAFDAAKPLICVCPPAGWALVPLARRWADGAPDALDLVLAADPSTVTELADHLRAVSELGTVHAATGLARTGRLLAARAVRTLVLTPPDALALGRQSLLPLAAVRRVVLAWPEQMLALEQGEALDAVLAETGHAQRLIVTADERLPALADLCMRIAHRAPVAHLAPLPESRLNVPVRYVLAPGDRRAVTARAVLDTLHPDRVRVWTPSSGSGGWAPLFGDPVVHAVGADDAPDRVPLAVAGDLPSAEVLTTLAAGADDVVVLLRPGQLPYLQRLTAPIRSLRVVGDADAAVDRAAAIRRRLRERLADGSLDGELLMVAPLLDEYDPAEVAAAALALMQLPPPLPETAAVAWARVFVTAGRRDGLRPGDLLGALVNEVGLPRPAVGKIDLRDGFALVEIRADESERAIRGLTGLTLRGKRVSARPDRR